MCFRNCKRQNVNFATSCAKVKQLSQAKINRKFLLGRATRMSKLFFVCLDFANLLKQFGNFWVHSKQINFCGRRGGFFTENNQQFFNFPSGSSITPLTERQGHRSPNNHETLLGGNQLCYFFSKGCLPTVVSEHHHKTLQFSEQVIH